MLMLLFFFVFILSSGVSRIFLVLLFFLDVIISFFIFILGSRFLYNIFFFLFFYVGKNCKFYLVSMFISLEVFVERV